MRKVEKQMLAALKAGKRFSLGNTLVTKEGEVFLHGHHIATRHDDGTTTFSMCGYGTSTTRSRLRALGIRVYQRDWVQWADTADGEAVDVQVGTFKANKEGYVI